MNYEAVASATIGALFAILMIMIVVIVFHSRRLRESVPQLQQGGQHDQVAVANLREAVPVNRIGLDHVGEELYESLARDELQSLAGYPKVCPYDQVPKRAKA